MVICPACFKRIEGDVLSHKCPGSGTINPGHPIWTDPCDHFAEPGPYCRQCGVKVTRL